VIFSNVPRWRAKKSSLRSQLASPALPLAERGVLVALLRDVRFAYNFLQKTGLTMRFLTNCGK
jgi:hypothetical protein